MRLSLLVLAALLLAGCASPEAEDAPAADDANATTAAAAPLPPTEERVDDGTRTDLGHMPHMHDYWKGKERVTLFDDDVAADELDPFMTGFQLLVQKQAKAGGATWFLPEGAIVYEGTGLLEMTATWNDPKVTSLAVSYRTPESQDFLPPVKMESGTALPIEVTPAMTDMPHSKTSRWAFEFAPADSPGATLASFHLKVDVVKMRDIGLFPAHPELFEGKTEKVIHAAEHSHSEVSYAKRAPQLLEQGDFSEKEITPSQLVPMEAQWMLIEVDILDATASPGQVADIRFFYHGADRNVLGHPTILPIEGSLADKRLVYAVPVTMDETDTPYGSASQWRFFVEPATTFTGQDGEPDCGGCTDVTIAYKLTVTVYDHVPADAVASKLEGEE